MARIQLTYPKMPASGQAPLQRCIAFEKYDGTNLHWVWDAELGWHAFGTRRDRFDLDESGIADFASAHAGLSAAPLLFQQLLAQPLSDVLEAQTFYASSEIIAFTEFIGTHSFAGRHRDADEKKLILFDVQTAAGFLDPFSFVDHFADLSAARVVYRGKLTGRFTTDVREGRYNVAEGVVCKGGETGNVWMVKVKTNAYMARLQQAFADDWENFWE